MEVETKEKLWFLSVVMVVILVLVLLFKGCCTVARIEYSDGSRYGSITKFSKKGLIWKTWEGEMILGGLSATSDKGMVSNTWEFSIDREKRKGENVDELVRKVREAQESGDRIEVVYVESLISLPWRGSTSYFIQEVKESKNE